METNTEKKHRIVQLTVENVKKVRAVEINPEENFCIVAGNNDQGKSSTLDAIMYALGGKDTWPPKPIRDGAEKAVIRIATETFVVTRTITAGSTTLKVVGADGVQWRSPQELLDKLMTTISFDPLEFVQLKPDARLKIVRDLCGLDFTAKDTERERLYLSRRDLNRDMQQVAAKLSFFKPVADAPEKEESVSELLAQLKADNEFNAQNQRARNAVDVKMQEYTKSAKDVDAQEQLIVGLRKQLADAEAALEQMIKCKSARKQAVDEAVDKAAALVDRDTEALQNRIGEVEANNKKFAQNKQRAEVAKQADEFAQKIREVERKIEDIDEFKRTEIKNAKMPIPELSFTDAGVLLDGQPFEQASQSHQLRASVAIGCALNPKMPIMLIRRGSELDRKSLGELFAFAVEHDCQLFIERVGTDGPASVIIENGCVSEVRELKV